MEEAIALAEASLAEIERSGGSEEDRARVYFWSSIAWGARAQRVGLLTIVREGVAKRMHGLAEQSLALDPSVDRGGALRLLSRLHGDLPRVPFVSGWVDRDRTLPLAERAFREDPEHPGNRLILALALLAERDGDRERATELLTSAVTTPLDPAMLVEQTAIRKQAGEVLAELEAP